MLIRWTLHSQIPDADRVGKVHVGAQGRSCDLNKINIYKTIPKLDVAGSILHCAQMKAARLPFPSLPWSGLQVGGPRSNLAGRFVRGGRSDKGFDPLFAPR